MKKIKNFKLMLLGLLAMVSTNVFADEKIDEAARSDGYVLYELKTTTNGNNVTKTALVVGVNPDAVEADVQELTIKAVVSSEKGDYNVIGFKPDFADKLAAAATKTKKLTVNGTNMGAGALNGVNFAAFTILEELTISAKAKTTNPAFDGALTEFPTLGTPNTTLKKLDISACPDVTAVPNNAFNGGKLTSISLPAGVKTIGTSAFEGCKDLTTFAFGANLETIGASAFKGTGLTAVDLSGTKVKLINNAVFKNTKLTSLTLHAETTGIESEAFENVATLTSVTLPAKVGYVGAYAFSKCEELATVTLADPKSVGLISNNAFAYTAIAEFTVNGGQVKANAFEGCNQLKTFNFVNPTLPVNGPQVALTDDIDVNAFIGCIPFVTINTPEEYIFAWRQAHGYQVPVNGKWNAVAAPIVPDGTIAFNASGFAKWWHNTKNIVVDATKYKAFSVYVDNEGSKSTAGTAYFIGLKNINGNYSIPAGKHVIFQKLDSEKEGVEYMVEENGGPNGVFTDEMFSFGADYTLAQYQTNAAEFFANNEATNHGWYAGGIAPGYYLYRLTANNGIGFRLFTGQTLVGGKDDTADKAQFFIQSVRQPDAAGRLECVWLDENGNVINVNNAATAIEKVEAAAEDGAVYNLAGQKVDANYKGVIIKNGKKYIK